MNEALISNWNKVVGQSDMVYHLGDFAFGRDITPCSARIIRKRLNGRICLIRGNHEAIAEHIAGEPEMHFQWIKDYAEIEVAGQKIVLFHYGMRTWHHDLHGVWHLYGHSHDRLPPFGKSFDIGVDSWDFKPLSFIEVKAEMDKRDIAKGLPSFLCKECNKFPCECDDEIQKGGLMPMANIGH
jgi:calcineurin-like phosphoesterase family protein